jgi:YegS/Rv2252/BmrU family lipid kinase
VTRIAVVVNPISGSRSAARALSEFRSELELRGAEVGVRETRRAGDGAAIARSEAESGVDVVVAAGGDGTVNEVARGLGAFSGRAPPFAILPRGTSNLVARDLSLPFRARENARVVLDGEAVPFDLGEADGRPFVACMGVGWDAHVVRLLARARKGHISFATWSKPIAQALWEYRFEPLRVTAADGTWVEGEFALIFNTRPYAAFFTPMPEARRDDGLLDALVLRKGGFLDVPRWTWKGLRGTLAMDASAGTLHSTSFRIEAPRPLPVQIDGDVGGETPVDILVRPSALRVMRPVAR